MHIVTEMTLAAPAAFDIDRGLGNLEKLAAGIATAFFILLGAAILLRGLRSQQVSKAADGAIIGIFAAIPIALGLGGIVYFTGIGTGVLKFFGAI